MELLRIPSAPERKRSKVTKSPFYFFMMFKKAEWEEEGRWSPKKTMEDLVHETFPIWKVNQQEDPEFMVPFIEMHRKWKAEQMGDLENKYDALGRPLADIEREMARQRKKVMDMEKEVEETVVKAKDRSSLNRTLFYVGYFNCL